jgi:hypothetical protein
MAGRPSAEVFGRVCRLIDRAEEAAPGLYAERWRGYLLGHMGRWQARHCAVVLEQREEAERVAGRPWAELVKGVELERFDLSDREDVSWVAGELRERFPGLEHLGVARTSIRKAAVELACEEGVFDGLRSLSFEQVGLHHVTLEVVMDRLEARDELEHLRFAGCAMGSSQFERIIGTSLAPRLRSLGMPEHAKFKAPMAAALADRAAAFEVLERLDLRACAVAGGGAEALANADWPDTFAYLDLKENTLRGKGIKALAARGLLGCLLEEDGEKTLDLGRQQIGNAGLQVVVGSGVLDGVVHLNLWGCNLTSLEALREAEGLEQLRELNLGGNEWADREDGGALLEVIARMERLESLSVARRGLGEDFVARLLAGPGVACLRELEFEYWATCTEVDLRAVLDWDGLEGLERLEMSVELPPEHELIARVERTGWFRAVRYEWGEVRVTVEAEIP